MSAAVRCSLAGWCRTSSGDLDLDRMFFVSFQFVFGRGGPGAYLVKRFGDIPAV
jgi:hypothetical protein